MNSATLSTFKRDFLASIVVFLVALPLCMGIAIACGAPVAAGLITGIVGGIVVGAIAGCPLQVSGPAAGLIVLVYEIVDKYGLDALGITVLIAGVLQLVAGSLRLGQWFRAVSPAVIKGMLAGIGVLIVASQFHVMVDDRPKGSGLENLMTIPSAVVKSLSFEDFHNRELRQFRAETLRTVGDLHGRQSHLQHATGEFHIAPGSSLVELTEEQEALTRELEAMAAGLAHNAVSPNNGERTRAIQEASAAALAHSQTALAALRDGDMEQAHALQGQATASLGELLGHLKNHSFAALIGVLAILGIVLWQAFAPAQIRVVPGPLVAVVLATAVAAVLMLPVLYVEVPSNLWEELHFPTMAVFSKVPWQDLVRFAVVIAVVASAETLLCATAVDQLHNGARTRYNRELCAQGVGNMICGCLGALPMTGVIVRSSANIGAGAATRLSAILHGVWLLVFVVGLAFLLQLIPTAALAAILVYTGYKLVDIKSIKELRKYGWGEIGIYAATVVTIVATDLLAGVLVGVALAAVKLLYTFSHLETKLETLPGGKRAVLRLEGTATFLRLPRLARELDKVPKSAELHVEFERLDYIDHACLDLLMTWAKQHAATGGKLIIDWESLHASFHRDANGAAVKSESPVERKTEEKVKPTAFAETTT